MSQRRTPLKDAAPIKISLAMARRLAIRAQGLDGGWDLPAAKEGVAQTVERLGYVQIDTIAVVNRAHHHTLWARRPDYGPEMLDELHAHDRRVFEGWLHAAAFLPLCDYRYYLPGMRAVAQGKRASGWLERNAELAANVRRRIRDEGPLASADFAAPPGTRRGPWWDWKPAKRALEMLFAMGELMICRRRNFQRVYDLTERVLPPTIDVSEPTPAELAQFAVRRAMNGFGVAAAGDIRWGRGNGKHLLPAIAELTAAGELVAVEIEGCDGESWYALADALEHAATPTSGEAPVHVLSPFDNLVFRRQRLRRLFDFDFKLECYFPAAKRQYGYFCLPILWGEQLVARLDAKADRREKALILRRLIFEPGFDDFDGVLPALAAKLHAFAAFNNCERIVVESTKPAKAKAPLARELKAAN